MPDSPPDSEHHLSPPGASYSLRSPGSFSNSTTHYGSPDTGVSASVSSPVSTGFPAGVATVDAAVYQGPAVGVTDLDAIDYDLPLQLISPEAMSLPLKSQQEQAQVVLPSRGLVGSTAVQYNQGRKASPGRRSRVSPEVEVPHISKRKRRETDASDHLEVKRI